MNYPEFSRALREFKDFCKAHPEWPGEDEDDTPEYRALSKEYFRLWQAAEFASGMGHTEFERWMHENGYE